MKLYIPKGMTNHRNKIIVLSLVFITFSTFIVRGQDLPQEKVEVVKDFEARLIEAKKITQKADYQEAIPDRNFDYDIQERKLELNYEAPDIKARGVSVESQEEVYNGFLKAGATYPLGAYLDAGFYTPINDNGTFVIKGFHHSSNNNKEVENQQFSNSEVNIGGSLVSDVGFAIEGGIGAELDRYHFYGKITPDSSYSAEQVRHKLNNYSVAARFYNPERTAADLDYWIDLKANRFSNNFATKETGLDLDLGLSKWINESPLSLNLGTKFVTLKDTSTKELNQFYINPTFTFTKQAFGFRLGGRAIAADEKFTIFPDVEATVQVLGNTLSIFAGAGGNMDQNSYKLLSAINPFMIAEISGLRNTSYFDFYAGVKGATEGFEYNARIGFKPTKDLPFFIVDTQKDFYRFDIGYDSTDIFYFEAVAKGKLFSQLELSATLTKNIFSPTIQEKAWYLPKGELNIGAMYHTANSKLLFRGDLFFREMVDFIELETPGEQPNILVDVSLGAEYFFTEQLGIFLNLNNLSSTKYVRWYGYPSYGINVAGGVTARF